MKTTFIFCFLFFCFSISMAQDFSIIYRKDIFHLLEDEKIDPMDIAYQLQTNHAFIYSLSQDRWLAYIPGSDRGILFFNEAALKEAIEKDYFPISLIPEKPGLFENTPLEIYEIERLKNLEENIDYYFSFVKSSLSIDHDTLDYEFISLSLNKAHSLFYNKKNWSPTLLIALAVCLGEASRVHRKGVWEIRKKYYYYNAYYEFFVKFPELDYLILPLSKVDGFMSLPNLGLESIRIGCFDFSEKTIWRVYKGD